MCGIIGVISKEAGGLFQFDAEAIETLLITNSVRGKDSTGLFGVSRYNEVDIIKQGSDPLILIQTPEYEKFKKKIVQNFHIVVGHNRKATIGDINSTNAHPFKEDHIILVHNGMLHNHKSIKEADVDSQALCHAIAKDGIEATVQKITGAFAIVWYDLKEKALFMWNNGERPLAVYHTDSRMFFASELGMLQWVLNRENLPYTLKTMGELKPNVLTKITINPFKLFSADLKYMTYFDRPSSDPIPELGTPPVDDVHLPIVYENKAFNDEVAEVTLDIQSAALSVLDVKDKYPIDTSVLFHQTKYGIFTEKPLIFRIEGTIYLPGKPPVNAISYTRGLTAEQCKELYTTNHGLLGEVDKVIRMTNGEITIHIRNLQKPETVTLCQRTVMPVMEWSRICASMKCQFCQGLLQGKNHEHGKTLVYRYGLGRYKITCSTCLKNSIPEDKQDAFFKGRHSAL